MKKRLFTFSVAAFTLALLFSGCGKKAKSDISFDYLPVQMEKNSSWSIIDKDGKEVVKEEYPSDAQLSLICDGAYWVYSNEKYQLYNLDNPKKPVTDEEFATATNFNAGVAVVGNPNQQIRIVDTKGNTVAKLGKEIKRCNAFTEDGYAVVCNTNDKVGLIDTKGNTIIAPAYVRLYSPSEGLLIAEKEEGHKKALIINLKGEKQGEINLDKYYLLTEHFHEGKLLVRNAGDTDAPTVVLNTKGEKLFELKKAKQVFWAPSYANGYVSFGNGDEVGVADDKGEVIIRPKYKSIVNLANGTFAAKKEDKWGIINTDDKTIIDFDYDGFAAIMGDNYIFKDGSSWSLVDKNGKEITSFANSDAHADNYVEYVDVSGITASVYNHISKYEAAYTPAQLAKELSLSLDNYHYQRYIESTFDVDGKAEVELTSWYSDNVAEEQTHQEEVNDGWFTSTRTVSDGWNWSTSIPYIVKGSVKLKDDNINLKDFYKALLAKVAEGRTKVSDNVFTKNIQAGGSTVECRITLEQNYNNIGVSIEFVN